MTNLITTLQRVELWLDSLATELASPVPDFPDWSLLAVPGKTQEYLTIFAQERAKVANWLISLYSQKRNLRKIMGVSSESDDTPHKYRGSLTKAKGYLVEVQELIGMAQERKANAESAINVLRSIQSSITHSDTHIANPFSVLSDTL